MHIRMKMAGWALGVALMACQPALADDRFADGFMAALSGDYRTAADHWTPLAAENDGRAQFQLGLMYHAGLHVAQDEKKAVQLYHSAAENGVHEAQEYLAVGYANGWFGLKKNEARAAYWLSRLTPDAARQLAQR